MYLVDGIGRYEEQLKQLGPHTTGVGCRYIKDLDKTDLLGARSIATDFSRTLTAATYELQAREATLESPD